MLMLRTLLDSMGAVVGDVTHNTATVQAMFPLPGAAVASSRHSSSPAARTAAFVRKQLAIHQRLWEMSEGYTTNDTRTVRSVDVSQLDDLYDIVNEACSTNLFAIQTVCADQQPPDVGEDATETTADSAAHPQTEHGTDMVTPWEEEKSTDEPTTAVPVARRLLLDAILNGCTVAELHYFFNKLPLSMQNQWSLLSRALS